MTEAAFPQSWIPRAAGDEISGSFVRLDTGFGKEGDTCPIVVLRDSDGVEHGLWLWHSVLRADFARLKPEPDELIRVEYHGKRTSAKNKDRSYHNYSVEAPERAVSSSPDWDSLAEPTSPNMGGPSTADDDGIPF